MKVMLVAAAVLAASGAPGLALAGNPASVSSATTTHVQIMQARIPALNRDGMPGGRGSVIGVGLRTTIAHPNLPMLADARPWAAQRPAVLSPAAYMLNENAASGQVRYCRAKVQFGFDGTQSIDVVYFMSAEQAKFGCEAYRFSPFLLGFGFLDGPY